jgi:hypothetical protein
MYSIGSTYVCEAACYLMGCANAPPIMRANALHQAYNERDLVGSNPNQPLVSSRSRSRQVQHPQQKLFLINIISWQYVREATCQFMGFTPQDRTFSHHGPREVVTLDRILHSPLCLPIRDRDKYNT